MSHPVFGWYMTARSSLSCPIHTTNHAVGLALVSHRGSPHDSPRCSPRFCTAAKKKRANNHNENERCIRDRTFHSKERAKGAAFGPPSGHGVPIYKGMKLYLTKNIRKEDDYINGMLCEVISFEPDTNGGVLWIWTWTNPAASDHHWVRSRAPRLVVLPDSLGLLQYGS